MELKKLKDFTDFDKADLPLRVMEEVKNLFNTAPDHELIRYYRDVKHPGVWQEYLSRFWKPGIPITPENAREAWVYTDYLYLKALLEAQKDPKKPIIVTHEEDP